MRRLLLTIGLVFGMTSTANAIPCFQPSGLTMYGCPGTNYSESYRPAHDEVLSRDAAQAPAYKAHVITTGTGRDARTLRGIADMSGRLIGPVQFDKVYVVSHTLGVGEVQTDPRVPSSRRAFLIDLKSGELRATVFRAIKPTEVRLGAEVPYLIGVPPTENPEWPKIVAILLPTGEDSGLRLQTQARRVSSNPNGLLGMEQERYTISGEAPAGGRPLERVGDWGMFETLGPRPAEIAGPAGRSPNLLLPLDSVGQLQTLPPGVLGIVPGDAALWTVRRTPAGLRFHRFDKRAGVPNLVETSAGEGYTGLFIGNHVDLAKTSSGWVDPSTGATFATMEEGIAKEEDRIANFVAQVRREEAERPLREAQARREAEAAGVAARTAARANTLERIEQAKREGWSGFRLYDLQREVIGHGLGGRYAAAGLYVSPDFKRELCWSTQSVLWCEPSAPSSSSSGFVSTWEQAFANSRALNQQQGRDNCTAASMGASRICNQR